MYKNLFLSVCLLLMVSCGDNDRVRSYTEESPKTEKPVQPIAQPEHAETARLTWKAPENWQENEGSGFRRAWFAIPAAGGAIVCTMVVLQGDGGGLEPNVNRWLSQLNMNPGSGTGSGRFSPRQDKFRTSGGLPAVCVDFTGLKNDPDSNSMLVSVVSLPGETVFIKITGTKKVLQKNKADLLAFTKSLRIGSQPEREKK